MATIRKYGHLIFLGVLAFGVAAVWYAVFYFADAGNLRVTFFDVGQGDAIFIEAPGGNQILVDGGPDDRILARLGSVLPFWDRSVDLLVLTHPHADHLAGLIAVLGRYDVGVVMTSGAAHTTPEYEEWERILTKRGMPVTAARKGQRVDAGNGVILDILSPAEDAAAAAGHPHDANIVARLLYGETTVLLTGDAERALEYRLVFESPALLDSDILKVGHHGSKTSSSEEFLKTVSPDIAIVSAGRKNKYGHPHADVMERFKKLGIAVRRTDTDGDIVIKSDGVSYRLISRE